MQPRILLADDHAVLLREIRTLLERRFEVVGSATDGHQLVAAAAALRPDAIVLDIGMPVLNGIEAARLIRRDLPGTKLIFLTQQSDRAYVQEAFRIGASAYVLKQSAASELETALSQALAGQTYVSSSIRRPEPFGPSQSPTGDGAFVRRAPTSRQREILQLVWQSKSLGEIATALSTSERTIRFQLEALLDELGLQTTEELRQYALEHGLVNK